MQQGKLRVLLVGLGSVGAEIARLLTDRRDVEIAAAVDAHPTRAGKDLGEVMGLGRSTGVQIAYDHQLILAQTNAPVVLHTTDASLTSVYQQIIACLDAGKNVISNCEELTFPWARYPELAERLDDHARRNGVCVLGAAVNPGFIMDTLPVLLTVTCQQVAAIRVRRVADAPPDRLEVRARCGIGLSPQGFQRAANEGSVGYGGLRESALMIADTLGWHLDEVTETIAPILAAGRVKTPYFSVEKGCVRGLNQRLSALVGGRQTLQLEMQISLGAEGARDEIEIDGHPPLKVTIPGGIDPQAATAAVMINCLPAIAYSGASGLLSMRDMPIAPHRGPSSAVLEELVS